MFGVLGSLVDWSMT